MANDETSLAERGYRRLLRFFPPELRSDYEEQMVSLFRDMEREAGETGRLARSGFVARAYLDVLLHQARARRFERARVRPRKERRSRMTTWKHDLIVALRFLHKQPGFTLVAAITLALGIGANTAIFSVLYGVLLRPLGLSEPDALAVVRLHRTEQPGDVSGFHPAYLEDLRRALETSSEAARLTSYIYESATLVEGDRVSEIDGVVAVEWSFFDVMGVTPLMGRTFAEADAPPNDRGRVCVISESLWRGRFGADPDILGRHLDLDGASVVVVGVVPAHIPLPDASSRLWFPQTWDPEDSTLLGRLMVVARLRDVESFEGARSTFERTAVELGAKYPRFEDYTMSLVAFRETLVGNARPAILLAAVAVSLILIIACANTANLVLSRATMRGTEIATRLAIGARRGQLASQLLTESLALAAIGGCLGVLVAFGFHRLLLSMAPSYMPRLAAVQLDLPVLGFSLAITLLTGLVFGLVPLAHTLGARRATLGERVFIRQGWASHALVVAQVTLSVVLLVSAALMARSLFHLQRVSLGFENDGLAGARVYLDDEAYGEDAEQALYFERLLERLRARGDIEAAGAGSGLPMDPVTIDYDLPYLVPGEDRARNDVRQSFFRTITPGYIETLGIPLKAGRLLDSRDRTDTEKVALVNETFARIAWPGENPVGESFFIYGGRLELRVVGVVGDVHFTGPSAAYKPEFFVPHAQAPFGAMTVVARSRDGKAEAAAHAIAEEALAIDERQPVNSSFTMDALVAGAVSTDRFLAWLLGLFAGVALLISAAGIYGVISYWVNQSRRELGVRMAFGAGAEAIMAIVLRRGLGLSLAGALLGLLLSLGATRLLGRFLYEVTPHDGQAMSLVLILLGATAFAASFLPAWKAAHADPSASLRAD